MSLFEKGEIREAIAIYDRAIAADLVALTHTRIGIAQSSLGTGEEAIKSYRAAISIKPDYAEAYHYLTSLIDFEVDSPELRAMEEIYRKGQLSDIERSHLCFGLAKAYEDIDQFELAFRFLTEGNSLRKEHLNYSIWRIKNIFMN